MNSGGDNNLGQNPGGANPWLSAAQAQQPVAAPQYQQELQYQQISPADLQGAAPSPVAPVSSPAPTPVSAPQFDPNVSSFSTPASSSATGFQPSANNFNAPINPIISSAPDEPAQTSPSLIPGATPSRRYRASRTTAIRADAPEFFSQAYAQNIATEQQNAYQRAHRRKTIVKVASICGVVVVVLGAVLALALSFSKGGVFVSWGDKEQLQAFDALAYSDDEDIAVFEEFIQDSYAAKYSLGDFLTMNTAVTKEEAETYSGVKTRLQSISDQLADMRVKDDLEIEHVKVNQAVVRGRDFLTAHKADYDRFVDIYLKVLEYSQANDYRGLADYMESLDGQAAKDFALALRYYAQLVARFKGQTACDSHQDVICLTPEQGIASSYEQYPELQAIFSGEAWSEFLKQEIPNLTEVSDSQTMTWVIRDLHSVAQSGQEESKDETK